MNVPNLKRCSYLLTKSIFYSGESYIAKNLAAGMAHTCAILIDDRVMCWGLNNRGQLGISNVNQTLKPSFEVSGIPSGQGLLINGCFLLFRYSTCLLDVSLSSSAPIFELYLPSSIFIAPIFKLYLPSSNKQVYRSFQLEVSILVQC